jgi:hypothetical protein
VLRTGKSSAAAVAAHAASSDVAHVAMTMVFITMPSLAEREGEKRSSAYFRC